MLLQSLSSVDFGQLVLAVGALGTAAYGLVDASKAFGGGASNHGFGDIRKVIAKLLPQRSGDPGIGLLSALATLRANWLNGMSLADQKSVAKALVKLNLPGSARNMAAVTGVNADVLERIARKLGTELALEPEETNTYGRFDLSLSALLDQAYQRADQRYRNFAKFWAAIVALILSFFGAWSIQGARPTGPELWRPILIGLLATPLSPVAKDVASAIQAGRAAVQFGKR